MLVIYYLIFIYKIQFKNISLSTQSSIILRLRAQYPQIWGLGTLIELKENGQTSEGMSLRHSPASKGFSFLYTGHKNENVRNTVTDVPDGSVTEMCNFPFSSTTYSSERIQQTDQ